MTYKLCYIQVHVPIDNVRIIQLNGRGVQELAFLVQISSKILNRQNLEICSKMKAAYL